MIEINAGWTSFTVHGAHKEVFSDAPCDFTRYAATDSWAYSYYLDITNGCYH